jgi:hypothetical protein
MVNLNEMSVYGPFIFPKVGTDPIITGAASAYYFDEIVLDVIEFNGQAINNPNNKKSHFTFSTLDILDGRLSLTPKYNNFTFGRLQDNTPSSLTFGFYTPEEPALFDDDFFSVNIDYSAYPYTYSIIPESNGTGVNPNLVIGTDVIAFQNFYDSSILKAVYNSDDPKSIVYHSVYYNITAYTFIAGSGVYPVANYFTMQLAGPIGSGTIYNDISTDINRPGDLTLGPPQANPICTIIVISPRVVNFRAPYRTGLVTGDIVTVTAVNPNNPTLNYLPPGYPTSTPGFLAQLFRKQGWPVNVVDPTTFNISSGIPFGLDMLPLTTVIGTSPTIAPVTATFGPWPRINLQRLQTVLMYDGRRRIRIPMRFRGVVRTYVNYLIPVSN